MSTIDWWGPGTREEEQERGPERPQSRGEGEGPISLHRELVSAGVLDYKQLTVGSSFLVKTGPASHFG